jgi:hypothetical protein
MTIVKASDIEENSEIIDLGHVGEVAHVDLGGHRSIHRPEEHVHASTLPHERGVGDHGSMNLDNFAALIQEAIAAELA